MLKSAFFKILILSILILSYSITDAQNNSYGKVKRKRPSSFYGSWIRDTTLLANDTLEIRKRKQRYFWRSHGWVVKEILYQYDECNNLIGETKLKYRIGCSGGARGNTKYDRKYETSCPKN